MIYRKKVIIATWCFILVLPLTGWSEAPVVDDSENFAMIENQQATRSSVDLKNDEPQFEIVEQDNPRASAYADQQDDGSALVKDDGSSDVNTNTNLNDNAKLIEKIQNLQREIQELRGQLEVQAHDLKLLQQQQISFYKDLDSRLGTGASKTAPAKPVAISAPTEIGLGTKTAEAKVNNSVVTKSNIAEKVVAPKAALLKPVQQVSRANPADEQISYLAAYELVQSKHYEEAITAMEAFAQKYPSGGYTANAEYWLGELYLVEKNYSKAIEHFQIVLDQFTSSSKSAASLLKSGYAYAASGQNEEAVKRLQQVISTYPDTTTAQLAKSKLESINPV